MQRAALGVAVIAASTALAGCGGSSHVDQVVAHSARALKAAGAFRDGGTAGGSLSAGRAIERPLQAKWATYTVPSESAMAQELAAAINGKPTLTQVGAIEAAYVYTAELAKPGAAQKLAPGSAAQLLSAEEQRYPATKSPLAQDEPALKQEAATGATGARTNTGNLQPVSAPLTLTSVRSCLSNAGATIDGIKSLGHGAQALYALLPSDTNVAIGLAPTAAEAGATEGYLASHGYSVSAVKSDPDAFVVVRGTSHVSDMAIVSRCTS